ncbi:VCBS repeat-containing protein [Sorangium sp. So ce448]|uniref:FG-GAP repeat domain-containing protein n=1 Tax=Sorangium sp. So ce448 TaxID=3133314 RepID=UPI003F5FBFA3
MRFFRKKAALLGAFAAIGAAAACAESVDSPAEPGAADCASPPVGIAAQRINDAGWRIVEAADFNLDGMQDVIWNNPGENLMAITLLNGTRLAAQGPSILGPPGEGWGVTTAGDFNGDGMADAFWTNPGRSLMAVWLMDGTHVLAREPEFPRPDTFEPVTGVGDANFDGMADIVWHNPDRSLMMLWLMNGPRPLAAGPEIPAPSGAGWSGIVMADFNSDGMADVLWNNPDRNVMAVSLLHETELLAEGPAIPGPAGNGWRVVMAADFNSDGMADVLWGNPTISQMAVSLMNGAHLLAQGPELPGPPGQSWEVRTTGDTNFDGMADGVWQVTGTNRMAVYLMHSTQLFVPGPELSGPEGGE